MALCHQDGLNFCVTGWAIVGFIPFEIHRGPHLCGLGIDIATAHHTNGHDFKARRYGGITMGTHFFCHEISTFRIAISANCITFQIQAK
jgi:hypothetical protein